MNILVLNAILYTADEKGVLIPITTIAINQEKLGIAKDNWDETDLVEIIDNNRSYVDNCVNYRGKN
ncbi:MAG: hypothetical protein LBL07_00320 [Tannerella sp.]|jgi:predicted O-methyltransferase YrrM|nr:hypothetical protein [Tannerella sp.]